MHLSQEKLKFLLINSGIIDEKIFELAKEESVRLDQSLTNVLIGRGNVTEEYLLEILEPYFGVPIINLKQFDILPETLHLIPEAYAKSKNLAIFEQDKNKKVMKVAMLDPLDYDEIEFLRAKFDYWLEPYLSSRESLKHAFKQYKEEIATEFGQIITENVQKLLSVSGETDVVKLAGAIPVITILDKVIERAVELNASDIHFEPFEKEVLIRYRIDGILQEILKLHKAIEPILVARVKIISNLRIDEHNVPQDGRFRFQTEEGTTIDARVNVMPVMHGEKAAIRLLKSTTRPLSLPELGLSEKNLEIVMEEIKKPHGMILVTGPTGHGKTTTLYAILHILNTPKVNIMTIEDPIEYEIPRINQIQVNPKAGITFATGLRSLLRQNPDIMMVGEIRDAETVEIAIHSALTGHLVLSTLHTNNAPSAIPRLLDMGAPAFLLASTVNLILAQRLVRKICVSCIESYKLTPAIKSAVFSQLKFTGREIREIPQILYRGRGCAICANSGFQGQTSLFEILRVTDSIRVLVLKLTPLQEIKRQAEKEGMVSMLEDGLDKVEKGITTIEEVLRVVRE